MRTRYKLVLIVATSTAVVLLFFMLKNYFVFNNSSKIIDAITKKFDGYSPEVERHFRISRLFGDLQMMIFFIMPIVFVTIFNLKENLKNIVAVIFCTFFGIILGYILTPLIGVTVELMQALGVILLGYTIVYVIRKSKLG